MSALKFDIVALIANPGDYTSGERKQAAEAVGELVMRVHALQSAHLAFQQWKAKADKQEPAPRSILQMNVQAKTALFDALARIGDLP